MTTTSKALLFLCHVYVIVISLDQNRLLCCIKATFELHCLLDFGKKNSLCAVRAKISFFVWEATLH